MKTDKRKIGEWLSGLSSHDIYSSVDIKKELGELGYFGPWPHERTIGELRNHLGEFKGPEKIEGDYQEKTMNGWEIAEEVCVALTGRNPAEVYHGRGRRFDACVEELLKPEVA